MTATVELRAMASLMTTIAEAVADAKEDGMSNEKIAAILEMAREAVEAADE